MTTLVKIGNEFTGTAISVEGTSSSNKFVVVFQKASSGPFQKHDALEGTVKTLIIMPHNVIGAAPRQGHTIRGHIKQLMAERINANDIDRLMDCAHPCLTTDVGTTAYIDVFNIQ